MDYLKVHWHHDLPNEPVLLLSELDETRKIYIFRDGHSETAGADHETGSTFLGTDPMPSCAEIAKDPEFEVLPLTAAELERVWQDARRDAGMA